MNTLILRFMEDSADSFQHREAEALLVEAIPRRGESIAIDHNFHAVVNVVHNYDAEGIEVHLGPARETAEEAVQWMMENCDMVVAIEPVATAVSSAGGESPHETSED